MASGLSQYTTGEADLACPSLALALLTSTACRNVTSLCLPFPLLALERFEVNRLVEDGFYTMGHISMTNIGSGQT